jgi:ankyrin repeat protein
MQHYPCVSLLVEAAADVNEKDSQGQTALTRATLANDVIGFQIYLNHPWCRVDEEDLSGASALIAASRVGNFSMVESLLAFGASIERKDKGGLNSFLVACESSHVSVLDKLIKRGADINAVDPTGRNGLMLAARVGHVLCVEYLLELASFDIHHTDSNLYTALHHSAESGYME